MHRVLSWKRLLIALGVAGALVTCSVVVHGIQVQRQSAILKDRAEKAETDARDDIEKLNQAASLYAQYLRFQPKDEDAARKYTNLLFTIAKADPKQTQQAVDVTEKFLREFPNNPKERRKLVEALITARSYNSARQHLRILFDASTAEFNSDVELLRIAAECEIGAGEVPQAIKHLKTAIATGNAPVAIYQMLLEVYWFNRTIPGANTEVEDLIRQLVEGERFRKDVTARVAAAKFRLLQKDTGGARAYINSALEMPGGTTNRDVLLVAAEVATADSWTPEQIQKARTYLETAWNNDPKDIRAGVMLADVIRRQGKADEAIRILTRTAEGLGEPNPDYLLLVDHLLDLGEDKVSPGLIDRLDGNSSQKVAAKYFRGRLAVNRALTGTADSQNRDWKEARELLESVVPQLNRGAIFFRKAMVGLGQCYAAFQNPQKQRECFRAAWSDDFLYLPAILGEADALVKLGKIVSRDPANENDAVRLYRRIVNEFRREELRPTLVRMELLAVLQSSDNPNWKWFEASLGTPESRTAEVLVLYAESLLIRGGPENQAEAVKVLERVVKEAPENASAWVALARLRGFTGIGPTIDPLTTLDQAEKQLEGTRIKTGGSLTTRERVGFRLARAAVLSSRPTPQLVAILRKLGEGIDQYPAVERHRLWVGLGDAALRASGGQTDPAKSAEFRNLAIEFYRKGADADSRDLIVRSLLIDLGLAAGRQDLATTALAEIVAAEEPNGPIGTLGRLAIEFPKVMAMKDEAARRAMIQELKAAAKRALEARPGWSRVYVAMAQLDELEGQEDSALANYQQAIDVGERQISVIRRTYDLYMAPGRRQEGRAIALLNRVYTEANLPDDLERVRVVKKLLADDLPQSARPEIDRIAPPDTPENPVTDYRILLLRGALLAAIRADDDALTSFLAAVRRRDDVPDTWTALVSHLLRLGKQEDARRAIAQAEDKLRSRPPEKPAEQAQLLIGLAQCHEALGGILVRLPLAWARYQEAVLLVESNLTRLQPGDLLDPHREMVLFLQRTGNGARAASLLNTLMTRPEKNLARWARRHSALTLVTAPDAYQRRQDALKLIRLNLADTPPDPEDIKAEKVIETIDPETRAAAMKVLEDQFGKWGELTPDEYYRLGRLYFDKGEREKAEMYFEKAASPRAGVTVEHIAALVRVYLANNNIKRAIKAADRLSAAAPRSWEATRERARVSHRLAQAARADRDTAKAEALDNTARDMILKFPDSQTEINIATRTGPLLEELGFLTEARNLYTQLVVLSDQPGAHLPLAIHLIGQKQTAEAIKLAWEYEKKYPGRVPVVVTARILTGAVRARNPGSAVEREVEDWIEGKLREYAGKPEFPALLGARAELRDAQKRYGDAILDYRRALELSQSDLIVNNLCMLMALHERSPDDAIRLMSNIIAIRGPSPTFLDTRAVCYLIKGGDEATNLAIKDLELALVQKRTAVYLFHLAWAYDLRLEKRVFKTQVLDEAKKLGLTIEDLHPLEAPKFFDLDKVR